MTMQRKAWFSKDLVRVAARILLVGGLYLGLAAAWQSPAWSCGEPGGYPVAQGGNCTCTDTGTWRYCESQGNSGCELCNAQSVWGICAWFDFTDNHHCVCDKPWNNAGCGAGGCPVNQQQQTRNCGGLIENRCVPDATCCDPTYGAWSACSALCGGSGTQTRTNACGRTQTQGCQGPVETWGAWGACSASCGGSGTQTRTSSCGNTQTQGCQGPVETWGAWGACSPSCGPGNQSRTSSCGRTQTQGCNNGPCCDPNVWGAWGTCSASCGGGTQTRTNQCGTPQTQACNTQPCPSHVPQSWREM